MGLADKLYLEIVEEILSQRNNEELLLKTRTENRAYKTPHKIMNFDLEKEFPILTTKKVNWKNSVKELLWIYQDQSNSVKLLKEKYNVKFWDEWAWQDGSIGEAYGFVVKQYNQINKLLHTLKTDPQNRRMIIDLWQISHLSNCTLPPCCFLTMWDVSSDNKLNCMLIQRSGDIPLGVPFNMTQFAVLVHLIAKVTNLKPGLFTHVINNAHIYENQIKGMELQLARKGKDFEAPILKLNKDIINFYDFKPEDIELDNYNFHGRIDMPISV